MTKENERKAARRRGLEAAHLQTIEGNPLTDEEVAMFEMFDREGWSHERRRAYIVDTALSGKKVSAAE